MPDRRPPKSRRVPVLHVVTDDRLLRGMDFVSRAETILLAGADSVALHIRGPGAGGREIYELARALLPPAERAGARLLVNDRVDAAACAGVHGVQLGQRSLGPVEARSLLGPDGIVGASVHSADEAQAARGADFLVVGTLFETPSHPGRPGTGAALLRRVASAVPETPLVGIGGVTLERLPEIRRAGAAGFAVLRGVWEATSPARAVERYLTLWHDAQ